MFGAKTLEVTSSSEPSDVIVERRPDVKRTGDETSESTAKESKSNSLGKTTLQLTFFLFRD